MKSLLIAGMLGIGVTANAAQWMMSCSIDGSQEVGPTGSPGFGSGSFIIDDVANTVDYNITWGGTIGTETAAHFHGYAPAGVNAGVRSALPLGSPKIGTWNANATDISNILAGMIYVNIHTTAFGGGEIRGQVINPVLLPVELTSFTAASAANGIVLSWRTETETGNDRFVLERKLDGEDYSVVTEIRTQSSNGNSITPLSYHYVDSRVIAGMTYTYRLSQVDIDGDVAILRTASATMSGNTNGVVTDFALLNAYPNPFNPTAAISVQLQSASDASVAIYNMNGQLVRSLHSGALNAGAHTFTFDASDLASGNYLVRLTSPGFSVNKMITLMR